MGGAFLGTFRNAMGAFVPMNDEIPALVFVGNDPHLAIAKRVVDLHLASEMQDKSEIQRNIGAARRS